MEEREIKENYDKFKEVFNLNRYWNDYQDEESLKKTTRTLIYAFFYKMLTSTLTEKRFVFYKLYRDELDNVLRLNLCNLIDDAIIDLNHYLKYVEKYKDKDSVFYELDRLNDDYFDIHKIPEFNSKKYIREKIKHIGKIVSILGTKLNIMVPDSMEIEFGKKRYYSEYENTIRCIGAGFPNSYDLKEFWNYITPCATDEAILAKFELKLYLENVKTIRVEILNSIEEFELFLKLNFLSSFFTEREIHKMKEFLNFLKTFNKKHAKIFGHEELGYGETRRFKN